MKQTIIYLFLTLFIFSCNDAWKEELEEVKTELANQRALIEALQNKAFVEGIEREDNGYTILFSNGQSITLKNGETPSISIGSNGNWYVNGEDTGKPSQGVNGIDGKTPIISIGDNGNWVINDVDTGIKAEGSHGQDGKDAPSIVAIIENAVSLIFKFSDNTEFIVPWETNNTSSQISIQDAMSGYVGTIQIVNSKIVITKGFSLFMDGHRYPIECKNSYVIRTLDGMNNKSVIRTYVYIDTSVLGTTSNWLDGDDAKNIFIISDSLLSEKKYLLFATFYYQEPCGGLIDVYRENYNKKVEELYADKYDLCTNLVRNSDFKAFFFSDIHGSQSNLERIVRLANVWGSDYVDVIINGGDTNNSSLNSYSWYELEIHKSDVDILSCVGNHDCWINSWDWIEQKKIYDNYLSLTPKYFDVVQPQNAAKDGLLYYYKDYGKVRVIVIDGMQNKNDHYYWDNNEKVWFESVLSDAQIKGLAVLCVAHAPFAVNDATLEENITFNNVFGYKKNYKDDKISISQDDLRIEEEALVCIDEFIDNGGKFICWLSGHRHYDNVLYSINHPNQLMIVVKTAHYNRSSLDSAKTNNPSNIFYDCFNYIGVDLGLNILKIVRIGKNIDIALRPINVLCLDLSTHMVVSNY